MLNRALAFTFRNFLTLFLLALTVMLPLHLVQDYLWQDVVGVSELHHEVQELQGDATVDGVRPNDLARWRAAGWMILIFEVASSPLLVRAARRVLLDDVEGEVPTVIKAWSSALAAEGSGDIRRVWGPVISILVIAGASTVLVRETALSLSYFIPDDYRWIGVAFGEATSRALGAAIFVGVVAYLFTELPVPAKRSSSGSSGGTLDSTSV